MSAAIPSHTQQPSSLAAVPKAVWAVVGTLALATAGLGGALVARSVDKPAAEPVAAVQPAAPVAAAQPQAQVPVAQLQPAPNDGIPPVAQPAPQVREQSHAVKPKAKPVQQHAAVQHQQPAPAPVQQPQVVAQAPAPAPIAVTPVDTRPAAVCHTCGVVQAVTEVKIPAEQGSGIGAVGGVIAGGLLGNQVGGGNGKKLATVLGAVGGGFAGNEIEKRVRTTTAYDVHVRMEDGSTRTLRRGEPVAPGTRVQVEGNALRVSSGVPASEPRVLRTSGAGA